MVIVTCGYRPLGDCYSLHVIPTSQGIGDMTIFQHSNSFVWVRLTTILGEWVYCRLLAAVLVCCWRVHLLLFASCSAKIVQENRSIADH